MASLLGYRQAKLDTSGRAIHSNEDRLKQGIRTIACRRSLDDNRALMGLSVLVCPFVVEDDPAPSGRDHRADDLPGCKIKGRAMDRLWTFFRLVDGIEEGCQVAGCVKSQWLSVACCQVLEAYPFK